MSNSLRPHGLQHTRLPCPSTTPKTCSNSCPSRWWCHPTISTSVVPFSRFQSFPESGSFPVSQLFSTGAKVLKLQLQHQSFKWIFRVDFLQDWLIWSPCCPVDSKESSPAQQFGSIYFLVLSSSVHGILQARILEWLVIPLSRGSSLPRDQICVSALQADSLPYAPSGKPILMSLALKILMIYLLIFFSKASH